MNYFRLERRRGIGERKRAEVSDAQVQNSLTTEDTESAEKKEARHTVKGGAQRFSRGMTNFSAVWVGEKLTIFISFRPDLRPAARTSFSVICFWPLG